MAEFMALSTWADDEHAFAVDETPRGSTCKLDLDPKLGVFTLAKPLMAGLSYPYDWGFIPSTKAPHGDPLDVLIIHDTRTYPGVVLNAGLLESWSSNRNLVATRNETTRSSPGRTTLPPEADLEDIRDLPSRARDDLEEFFRAINALENKEVKFLGWRGPKHAAKIIRRLAR
ncbi:inorganic pyrophosphatase [Bradyrhizobium sp. USDA 4516]